MVSPLSSVTFFFCNTCNPHSLNMLIMNSSEWKYNFATFILKRQITVPWLRQIFVSNFCANPTDRRRWRAVTFFIQHANCLFKLFKPLVQTFFNQFWAETDRAFFTPLSTHSSPVNSELKYSLWKPAMVSCDNFIWRCCDVVKFKSSQSAFVC